ncbi:peptidoglycan/LPS O-acetylase OafA/YrhL [Mycobacterium sp. MAA66]|uniref:acyltransferase family protein n=1 Tax=Mycobacterium sp. MAA66 TaxID=3156297 RepID=UPI0035119A4D
MSVELCAANGAGQRGYAPLNTRPDLQGMRAFAVLTVFANHLFGWPRGGFVGVDVFFVLSGFFITALLLKQCAATGRISFADFYRRRVRRIIPSAVLVTVVTLIGSYLLLTAPRAKSALIDGLWATVFGSNWRFGRIGADYFAEGQPKSPLLHYWSLSIEEQFYFVWPLVLLGLFALTRRYSSNSETYSPARQRWLTGAMTTVCVLSFALACIQTHVNPTGAYFSTFTRVWELGVGALLAICAPLLAGLPDALRPLLSYLGLAGAIASLFVITPSSPFPGPWAALPVLSTALVIAAFVGGQVRAVPHLTNRVARYFGDVSYTLYLWHWPVIMLLSVLLPPAWPYYVTVIVSSLVLTHVTYRFYENPIRHSAWLDHGTRLFGRIQISQKIWATAGAVAAVAIAMSAVVIEVDANAHSPHDEDLVIDAAGPRVADASTTCTGAAALTTQGCVLYDPARPVAPSIDYFAHDGQGAFKCFGERTDPLESCTYGYRGAGAKRIAIVGDSHAAMLLPALSPYLMENHWNMTTFLGWGCQWTAHALENDDCKKAMPDIQHKLLSEKFDVIVTTASRQKAGDAEGFVKMWGPVVATGSKILAVGDVPVVSEETLDCMTRVGVIRNCATPRSTALATTDPILAAAAQVPGVTTLDMTNSFCGADKCPAIIGNVIVYQDVASHMTATYAKTLGPQLARSVRALMGSDPGGKRP